MFLGGRPSDPRSSWVDTSGVVVKIMAPFGVPNIVRHLLPRVPKTDHNFDNHPSSFKCLVGLQATETHVKLAYEAPDQGNKPWISLPKGNGVKHLGCFDEGCVIDVLGC